VLDLLRLDEAEEIFRRVLHLRPQKAGLHYNLGSILQNHGELEKAADCYREALRLDPGLKGIYGNLAGLLISQGKYDESVACYSDALKQDPLDVQSHSGLLLALNYLPNQDSDDIYKKHKSWEIEHGCSVGISSQYAGERNPERRLRIGYLSPDLRTHSVSYFFEPLLAHHNTSEVETFCYSSGAREDATTDCLRSFAKQWREIGVLDDEQVAGMIREDEIDILVDLSGHTARNRLTVFTKKPAPVQVTWLGYPNTTGLSSIDYRLTDILTDPPTTKSKYTEELVHIPGCFLCYQPPTDSLPVSSLPVDMVGYITFGSFNNLAKITPDVIRVWARLLQNVPDSRIIIKNCSLTDGATRERYFCMFEKQGVPRANIELLEFTATTEEHLALYGRVDISLDTFPYNGTTTTCEALWMGVPVVTLSGQVHAGRVGVSLLSAVDRQEWIAETNDAYVEIATDLAMNREQLATHRATLRERMASSQLCDGRSFAMKLEANYRAMWRQWCVQQSQMRK